MIAFLDTSALIKLYIAEIGSQNLEKWASGASLVVSQLTYGEVYATLARRLRENLLTAEEHQILCDAFATDWTGFSRIPFSDAVLAHVPGLCHRHPLRGADAMQLACVSMLKEEEIEVHFAVSDQRLLAAARDEGIRVFDLENP